MYAGTFILPKIVSGFVSGNCLALMVGVGIGGCYAGVPYGTVSCIVRRIALPLGSPIFPSRARVSGRFRSANSSSSMKEALDRECWIGGKCLPLAYSQPYTLVEFP